MSDKAVQATNQVFGRAIVPFTGGIIFCAYAFFWPEQYGHWLGTIVYAFKTTVWP